MEKILCKFFWNYELCFEHLLYERLRNVPESMHSMVGLC